jgi:hypothetical protein
VSEIERLHGVPAPKQPLDKLELTPRVGLMCGGQSFTGRGRYVNAVIDALAHAARNIDMPMTPDKVWEALNEVGLAE